jgi:hypothetical protein
MIRMLIARGMKTQPELEDAKNWSYCWPCSHDILQIWECFMQDGCDIQDCTVPHKTTVEHPDILACVAVDEKMAELKAQQLRSWSVGEGIQQMKSVAQLQKLVEENGTDVRNARDRIGSSLVKLAAVNNRADVLEWLWNTHGVDINAKDSSRRNALNYCQQSGSLQAARAVVEMIAARKVRNFCMDRYIRVKNLRRARTRRALLRASVTKLQAMSRGRSARRTYGPLLQEKRATWEAFTGKWKGVIAALGDPGSRKQFLWTEERFKHDLALEWASEEQEPAVSTAVAAAGPGGRGVPGHVPQEGGAAGAGEPHLRAEQAPQALRGAGLRDKAGRWAAHSVDAAEARGLAAAPAGKSFLSLCILLHYSRHLPVLLLLLLGLLYAGLVCLEARPRESLRQSDRSSMQ